ncbi:NUDIX domain-containing protein [Amycolatopsis sp. NPDC059657]|uniref:NUDIX domain-containing protein n=1 Tax=Amycolatopsis sp. NPDC059657 TaxID=3346899 RepID=UPI0036720D17
MSACLMEARVAAVICRDGHLLASSSGSGAACLLPGGLVHAGEPIELALRRVVRMLIGIAVVETEFLAVVERRYRDDRGRAIHEITFVFDACLEQRLDQSEARPGYVWLELEELGASDLQPVQVREGLAAGRFDNSPWLSITSR